MSANTQLFQPPSKYPKPPKDMWYEVPSKSVQEAKPKPLFPWEHNAPKPTRVFPDVKAPSPEPEDEPVETPSAATDTSQPEDSPPTPIMSSPDPWQGFQTRSNAWDDVPEIDRYVQAINSFRKGKIQVLHHTPSRPTGSTQEADSERRPSTKLTDFPTEVERPSLPVTPAPIRRPSFWGEERDQAGNLPAAEGVPNQEEWVRLFSHPNPNDFTRSRSLHLIPSPFLGLWRCQHC